MEADNPFGRIPSTSLTTQSLFPKPVLSHGGLFQRATPSLSTIFTRSDTFGSPVSTSSDNLFQMTSGSRSSGFSNSPPIFGQSLSNQLVFANSTPEQSFSGIQSSKHSSVFSVDVKQPTTNVKLPFNQTPQNVSFSSAFGPCSSNIKIERDDDFSQPTSSMAGKNQYGALFGKRKFQDNVQHGPTSTTATTSHGSKHTKVLFGKVAQMELPKSRDSGCDNEISSHFGGNLNQELKRDTNLFMTQSSSSLSSQDIEPITVFGKAKSSPKPLFEVGHLLAKKSSEPNVATLFQRDFSQAETGKKLFGKPVLPATSRSDETLHHHNSSSECDYSELTAISCKHLPPGFLTVSRLRTYFSKFGEVRRVFPNPPKQSAIIHFNTHVCVTY